MSAPTPREFERLVAKLLVSHGQKMMGDRLSHFEKALASVLGAYLQALEGEGGWVTIQ